MSTISIIAAVADDNSIGKDLDLLWRLPADMKHFKNITTGHTIIMGRKTFDSLPKGALPNRKNIIISSSAENKFKDCEHFRSIKEALGACKDEEEVFIIGGATIYNQTISMADKLYITHVHETFPDANVHFPTINREEWQETERNECESDEKNPFAHTFSTYHRIKR